MVIENRNFDSREKYRFTLFFSCHYRFILFRYRANAPKATVADALSELIIYTRFEIRKTTVTDCAQRVQVDELETLQLAEI
jgi:hypothetical protein